MWSKPSQERGGLYLYRMVNHLVGNQWRSTACLSHLAFSLPSHWCLFSIWYDECTSSHPTAFPTSPMCCLMFSHVLPRSLSRCAWLQLQAKHQLERKPALHKTTPSGDRKRQARMWWQPPVCGLEQRWICHYRWPSCSRLCEIWWRVCVWEACSWGRLAGPSIGIK